MSNQRTQTIGWRAVALAVAALFLMPSIAACSSEPKPETQPCPQTCAEKRKQPILY